MGKSISARVMSNLLKFWPKLTAQESEQKLSDALKAGEKTTPPPKNPAARYEDNENGRIFYVNEDSVSKYVIFYIHGGAYRHDIVLPHWQLINKLVKKTDAMVVVPAYRLVPFATYKEAFDLIVPVYKQILEKYPDKKIMMMGDSAGGGLSLSLTQHFKAENIRMPDELIMFSPWVDVSMENEQIKEYQLKDPFLFADSLLPPGKRWAGDLDIHDPKVSPIYGDLTGIRNVTVFVGTDEIIYPDVTKMFGMLDEDESNELIVGEGMNHVYPLFPIKEAVDSDAKIIQVVTR